MKKALITGIAGQDGSYLAELLLGKGYQVFGILRKEALEDPVNRMWRLRHIHDQLTLLPVSLESDASLYRCVEELQPDECYHLAARSFVSYSFNDGHETIDANIANTHYLLSALNQAAPDCRFYFPGSSEMFGHSSRAPQNEATPFRPRSPYGISKVAGFDLTRNYRESHNMFAACGILYNHESPRRGHEYVTRKISSNVARIKQGLETRIRLGNIDAQRDWGHARDYVHSMWLMLQQDEPDDYVIATGELHTVRELLDIAFACVGLDYQSYFEFDEKFFRPTEAVPLAGDASKIAKKLGWHPTTSFEALVEEMVAHDLGKPFAAPHGRPRHKASSVA